MKIKLSSLTPDQKDNLILNFQAKDAARLKSNNGLIGRLSPAPEPIADMFNEWSTLNNDIEEMSAREINRICGLADDGSKPTLQ